MPSFCASPFVSWSSEIHRTAPRRLVEQPRVRQELLSRIRKENANSFTTQIHAVTSDLPTNQSPPKISTRYLCENSYLGPQAPKKRNQTFSHTDYLPRSNQSPPPFIVTRDLGPPKTENSIKIPRINSGPRRSSSRNCEKGRKPI
jgi:hypothetical protein